MDEAIRNIERQIDKGSVTFKRMSKPLKLLEKEAELHGLSDEHLDVLLRLFDVQRKKKQTPPCGANVRVLALRCMLPQQVLQRKHALKLLRWIAVNYEGPPTPVYLGLQLLAGLWNYGLMEENTLYIFYDLFFQLLEQLRNIGTVCWLIRKLTKPDDVIRNKILHLLAIGRLFPKKKKALDTILRTFKIHRPEVVPESISAREVNSVLKLKKTFRVHFERLHSKLVPVKNNWKIGGNEKWEKKALIPAVKYFPVGMTDSQEKNTPVTHLRDWKAVQKGQINPAIPLQVMSLMQNSFGHHLLAFGGNRLQRRLSYNLFHTLHCVFIKRCWEVPIEEEEHLLEKLCELQEYMMQGIPITGRFLSMYMLCWDGHTHFELIMRLIERIAISSFDELDRGVLRFVHWLYMCSSVEMKCKILKHMLNLIINVVMSPLNECSVFLKPRGEVNYESVMRSLLRFFYKLCVNGLVAENADGCLLSHILILYRVMANVGMVSRVLFWAVIPPVVVYAALFSTDCSHLEAVAYLLNHYIVKTIPRINGLGRDKDFLEHKTLVKKYINDLMRKLWYGKPFKGRYEGFVFSRLGNRDLGLLKYYVSEMNLVFDATRHPTLSCMVKICLSSVCSCNTTKGAFLTTLGTVSPHLYSFTCSTLDKYLQKRKLQRKRRLSVVTK